MWYDPRRAMGRYPSRYAPSSFSFGPGPVSSTLRGLIVANVVIFLLQAFLPVITDVFGLRPALASRGWLWQFGTYMFLHGGLLHILFNMLALWMFGAELERLWGTRYFLRFYLFTGIGAGILTVAFSFLPFAAARQVYFSNVIGASGAIYGLLLAYGLYFPDRPIYFWMVFPIPARYFVMLVGAIAFYSSVSGTGGGIANATHLSGLLVAYLLIKWPHMHPLAEVKYRYVKWKINRARKKFDVYSGGRSNEWNRRVH